MTRRNGCHDRAAFRPAMLVQDGWVRIGVPQRDRSLDTRVPILVSVPFRNRTDCVYTTSDLGRVDAGCAGCRWRTP